jgi:hypothetical protein
MSSYTRAFAATALLALLGAAALHLLVLFQVGSVWAAMVHLTLFGWITGIILAVNYHVLPVFSGRDFPTTKLIWVHWAVWSFGILLAASGLMLRSPALELNGLLLECVGALLFFANTMLLFLRGSRHKRRPPMPFPDQPQVDAVGTQATKGAGLALPLALALLFTARAGGMGSGWVLAAEHLATLGWVMLMIVGVAYHVLPRFSGHPTRGVRWARSQLLCHMAAIVLIVLALGFNISTLFALGGLLMTGAVGLFAWAIWPTIRAVCAPTRSTIQLTPKEHTS